MISSTEKKAQEKQLKQWNFEVKSTSVKHITLVGSSTAAFANEPASAKDEIPPLFKASFFIQQFKQSNDCAIRDLVC